MCLDGSEKKGLRLLKKKKETWLAKPFKVVSKKVVFAKPFNTSLRIRRVLVQSSSLMSRSSKVFQDP